MCCDVGFLLLTEWEYFSHVVDSFALLSMPWEYEPT